ncbi:MAG: hypothetical protein NDI82_04935, partial [Anaeromyxobacteraceae bacterium]|nr:hypothetical protein [Anaeromyxobacteraceae bacterium]
APGPAEAALDGPIAAALDEARELERRARRLVLLAKFHGGEAAAQAWVEELQRESARGRSAVLARLEHGDLCGALGVALTLVDAVRARGLDAYARTLDAMGTAGGGASAWPSGPAPRTDRRPGRRASPGRPPS